MLITNKIIIYVLRMCLMLGIVLILLKTNKNYLLQKRYKNYTLEIINNNDVSIIDKKLRKKYQKV